MSAAPPDGASSRDAVDAVSPSVIIRAALTNPLDSSLSGSRFSLSSLRNLLRDTPPASVSPPVPSLFRWASSTAVGECKICFSPVLGSEKNGLRLGCGCLFHCNCTSEYVKSELGDSSKLARRGGIVCPASNYGCALDKSGGEERYFITPSEVVRLAEHYVSGLASGALEPLEHPVTGADGEKLRRFIEQSHDDLSPPEASLALQREASSTPYINATTKKCPKCTNLESHFHGHACHMVSCSSSRCRTEYCYRCLSSGPDNVRLRGKKENCECGLWHNFCSPMTSSSDISEFLKLDPYPHDTRCGCQICPECRHGSPCSTCHGGCCVCTGHVRPGPTELGTPYISEPDAGAPRGLRGYAGLYDAAQKGRAEDVRAAISPLGEGGEGLDANRPARDGRTALHFAAESGSSGVVEVLLAHSGIQTNKRDDKDLTPIDLALEFRRQDIVIALLHHDSPLLYAAYLGDVDRVSDLLSDDARDLNQGGANGYTALHWAASQAHVEVATMLLKSGRVDVNKVGRNSICALRCAVLSEPPSENIVQVLLNHEGIDANIEAVDGSTPLIAAVVTRNLPAVLALLRNDSQTDVNKGRNASPLLYAVDNFSFHDSRFRACLDSDLRSHQTFGSLFDGLGVESGNVLDIFSALLNSKGIDVNKGVRMEGDMLSALECAAGTTPLHDAAARDKREVARLLLQHKEIDPNRADEHLKTPLHDAAENGHDSIIALLLQHEAIDSYKRNANGKSALGIAIRFKGAYKSGMFRVRFLLLKHRSIFLASLFVAFAEPVLFLTVVGLAVLSKVLCIGLWVAGLSTSLALFSLVYVLRLSLTLVLCIPKGVHGLIGRREDVRDRCTPDGIRRLVHREVCWPCIMVVRATRGTIPDENIEERIQRMEDLDRIGVQLGDEDNAGGDRNV